MLLALMGIVFIIIGGFLIQAVDYVVSNEKRRR